MQYQNNYSHPKLIHNSEHRQMTLSWWSFI